MINIQIIINLENPTSYYLTMDFSITYNSNILWGNIVFLKL
jgi:hypothetical protein